NRGGNSGMLTGTSSGRISIASSSSLRCKAFTCVSFSLISKCISRAINLARKVNLARAKRIARGEKNVKVFLYHLSWVELLQSREQVIYLLCSRGDIYCCF